jgi:putative Ca2+/H+ antiporter (TMEM165/GDT1 family)
MLGGMARGGVVLAFDFKAVVITFGLVFLAELGDKTQRRN